MSWSREELKARGKIAMKSNYVACIAVAFLMGIVETLFSGTSSGNAGSAGTNMDSNSIKEALNYMSTPQFMRIFTLVMSAAVVLGIIGILLNVFVGNLLQIGGYKFFLLNQAGMQPKIDTVLDGFRSGHYGNLALSMFLMNLYISLWSLLFVIPGIVKSYEYRMVPYILAENPAMDRKTAFMISKRMMDGQKMDTFILDLSFIGWHILGAFTCGILNVLYVNPYVQATNAELYAVNKMRAFQEGYIR